MLFLRFVPKIRNGAAPDAVLNRIVVRDVPGTRHLRMLATTNIVHERSEPSPVLPSVSSSGRPRNENVRHLMLRGDTFVANQPPSERRRPPNPCASPTRRCLMTALVALAAFGIRPLQAGAQRPIVVASKSDTEGALTGSLIALVLEGLGLSVERKLGLGPTLIVRSALLSGRSTSIPNTPAMAPSSRAPRPIRSGRRGRAATIGSVNSMRNTVSSG